MARVRRVQQGQRRRYGGRAGGRAVAPPAWCSRRLQGNRTLTHESQQKDMQWPAAWAVVVLHARSAGTHAPAHRGGLCRSGTAPGSPPSCRRGPRVRCPSGPCPRPTSWARPKLVPGRRGPAPRGRAKSPPAWSPSSPDLTTREEAVATSSASPAPTKGQQGLAFLCTSQHAKRDSGGLRRQQPRTKLKIRG